MKVTTASPYSLVAGLVMLGLVVGLQGAVAQEANQCPPGGQEFFQSGTVDGVSFEASGSSLTLANTTTSEMATVSWCAEGTEEFSNGSKSSGVMSTSIPGGESKSAFFDQDISRFVVYGVEHRDSGGPRPPPRPRSGDGDDGGDGRDGGDRSGGGGGGGGSGASGASAASQTPSNAGVPAGSGAVAPPPPAIVGQPTVTG